MAGIVESLVKSVVSAALSEVLKKAGIKRATRRGKRQARDPDGRFKPSPSPKRVKARKQVSKRRTAAARSKQRSL
ncbi:hypothetical protein BJF93_09915 [Xaviernesmea oryzae]|uniref:Uncharacterized protein n=1 Tax=Xaviernesmea oryzae TaxID=464029 RepID=A0A1Q9AWV0_9HYPH|nr:hypothetical protein [Xaviernesmea oryzae]OLP59909.1 hypothetical protein BJF93_09915 [Xaviernesmea oryzae]SEK45673.1 hypothetical protein SAMN04487976_102229 [Xaviernesmea oryzae]